MALESKRGKENCAVFFKMLSYLSNSVRANGEHTIDFSGLQEIFSASMSFFCWPNRASSLTSPIGLSAPKLMIALWASAKDLLMNNNSIKDKQEGVIYK